MGRLLASVALFFAATMAAAGDPLFDAVAAGDTAAVERTLAAGADVDRFGHETRGRLSSTPPSQTSSP